MEAMLQTSQRLKAAPEGTGVRQHCKLKATQCRHVQIIWPKIDYLAASINLSPWYLQGSPLAAIEAAPGNASEGEAISSAASFGATATLNGPSAMMQAFAADPATSVQGIATTVSPFCAHSSLVHQSLRMPYCICMVHHGRRYRLGQSQSRGPVEVK